MALIREMIFLAIICEVFCTLPIYTRQYCVSSDITSGVVHDPRPLPRYPHDLFSTSLRLLKNSLVNRREFLNDNIQFVSTRRCNGRVLEAVAPRIRHVQQINLDRFLADVSRNLLSLGSLLYANGNLHAYNNHGIATFNYVQLRIRETLCQLYRLDSGGNQICKLPVDYTDLSINIDHLTSLRRHEQIMLEKCVLDSSILHITDVIQMWTVCRVLDNDVECLPDFKRRRSACVPLSRPKVSV